MNADLMGCPDCDRLLFSQAIVGATPELRIFARSLTRNVDDTDDLVQTTLAKAWAHQDKFKPAPCFKLGSGQFFATHFVINVASANGRFLTLTAIMPSNVACSLSKSIS